MELKSDLIEAKSKNPINSNLEITNLNESFISGSTAVYSPVAIKLEDQTTEKIVFLTESCVLYINEETRDLCQETNPGSIDIPLSHKRLMTALNNLNYDPGKNEFGLTADWDFTLKLTSAGTVELGREGIDKVIAVNKDDLPNLLLESINKYETLNKSINKSAYIQDADNFILLLENHSKLILLDECKTIKNLDSDEFVVVNLMESNKPRIIASSKKDIPLFESYNDMVPFIDRTIGASTIKLFESQVLFEQNLINTRFEKINELRESQKELNVLITDNKKLFNIADENSPAYDKLFEQSQKLNIALEENIAKLNEVENNFKFY